MTSNNTLLAHNHVISEYRNGSLSKVAECSLQKTERRNAPCSQTNYLQLKGVHSFCTSNYAFLNFLCWTKDIQGMLAITLISIPCRSSILKRRSMKLIQPFCASHSEHSTAVEFPNLGSLILLLFNSNCKGNNCVKI